MISERSYDYFLDNKDLWMRKHPGSFIVIQDGKLCGIYLDEANTEANAYKHGSDLLIIHLDPAGVKEYRLKKGFHH